MVVHPPPRRRQEVFLCAPYGLAWATLVSDCPEVLESQTSCEIKREVETYALNYSGHTSTQSTNNKDSQLRHIRERVTRASLTRIEDDHFRPGLLRIQRVCYLNERTSRHI